MSKQAMANYARNAIQAADDMAGAAGARGVAGAAKGWAPVFANVGAALAHAICELADAIDGKHKQEGTER